MTDDFRSELAPWVGGLRLSAQKEWVMFLVNLHERSFVGQPGHELRLVATLTGPTDDSSQPQETVSLEDDIEAKLKRILCSDGKARFVLRLKEGGETKWFFYTFTENPMLEKVSALKEEERYARLKIEIGLDPDWTIYREFTALADPG